MFTSISFGLFLIFYTVVFAKLVRRLKTHYPVFFNIEKKKIYTISGLLLFSIVVRIIIQAILSNTKILQQIYESVYNNGWLLPVVQLFSAVFGNILPLAVMVYSLKNTIRQKVEMQKSRQIAFK